jgi:hypothetical protein
MTTLIPKFQQNGIGAVNRAINLKLAESVSIKDFGAVGDGVTNDTVAWLAFKDYCNSTGLRGKVLAGTYLIDAFTFGPDDAGLVLEGEVSNPQSSSPTGAGGSTFGQPIPVFRLRTAGAKFVSFVQAYNMTISNIEFDGNQFADSVLYWDGTANNTYNVFNHCSFYGATPTTGAVHRYDGTIGGNNNYFNYCFLSQKHNFEAGATGAAYGIYNTNSNAFLIDYVGCQFYNFNIGARYTAGSCNLYGCSMYQITTTMIDIINVVQPFIVSQFYTESSTAAFFKQTLTAGVASPYPITIVNSIINGVNNVNLNCQQVVNIIGGFYGGDISVAPVVTYGVFTNIIESVTFNSGYGIIGTGAITNTSQRGVAVNNVARPTYDYGALALAKYSVSTNAGATLSVTNETWINISNSVAQNITGLTGGLVGQQIVLYFNDANSTLVNSGTLILGGSANVTPTANSIITLIGSGAAPGLTPVYWAEVSRSIK